MNKKRYCRRCDKNVVVVKIKCPICGKSDQLYGEDDRLAYVESTMSEDNPEIDKNC